MCGIVGIASVAPVETREWLVAGRDIMRHRGPDDAGEHWSSDGRVGFGHRRLSIIDLSPAGHQPMASAEGDLWITYNGEIYNYRALRAELEGLGHTFRSTSDTEVVLVAYRQWGRRFLDRLDGMFALALHDAREKVVLLARDRAGEKPLFYRYKNGELRFASELKALLADPSFERVVDPSSFDCYLAMGYVPGERSMLKGVSKLPPAHALAFDCASGAIEVWTYWTLPDYQGDGETNVDALVEELEVVLEGAVRRQLVADVPVGLLLSGGVDSSLITAMAVRNGSRLKTYTVGFPEFAQYDETPHAALIARHFGTEHTMLEADRADPEILDRLAWQYDEPMIDSSMIPTFLVSEQIRQHCKVALGGDGGDELFGGYYSASYAAWLERWVSRLPLWPRRLAAAAAMRLVPVGARGRNGMRILATDMRRDVLPATAHFDEVLRPKLLRDRSSTLIAEGVRTARVPPAGDAVQRMTRFDFANYMAEDILVKVDRASMLNSLEVRAPFLDRTVIEFAYGKVPSSLKATPEARKIILRKLAQRVLPPGFDAVRKQGFSIPLGRWLHEGPWRRRFEAILLDPGCTFAASEIRSLFRSIDKGRSVSEQLFGLALFEIWRREYGIAITPN